MSHIPGKVLLIHPPTRNSAALGASLGGEEHLGLEYVGAFLHRAGYDVDILNIEGNLRSPWAVAAQARLVDPTWIGISPTSLSMGWAIDFCNCVKSLKNIPLVFGGHLATHLGEDLLREVPNSDVVVLGDGEIQALGITQVFERQEASKLGSVPDIVFRLSGDIVRSHLRQPKLSLDDLPWPIRPHQLHNGRPKLDSARIITSRGCPYRCSFCTTPDFYNRSIRYRSMQDVVSEITWLYKQGATHFPIDDDIFFDGSPSSLLRIREFIRLVRENTPHISFRPSCRANTLLRYPGILKELKEIGVHCCFVGLESASGGDLDLFGKDLSPAENVAVVQLFRKTGVSLMPGFIMFTELSTFQSLQRNLEFLYNMDLLYRSTPISRTVLGFPGTRLFKEMRKTGNYDEERSNAFVLYPRFRDSRIRELSVAMQAVENMFSSLDRIMLQARIQLFDRIAYLDPHSIKIERSRHVLDEIAEKYFRSFRIVLRLAEDGANSDLLVLEFRDLLPEIECLTLTFENILNGKVA